MNFIWICTLSVSTAVLFTKIIFPSLHICGLLRAVLCYMSGELIHFALKYSMMQQGEKWEVRSSLHPPLQIGSNFIPLICICLFLLSSLFTSYQWLWSQHPLPSKGLEHISVSKDVMRETERIHDEFSVEATGEMSTRISQCSRCLVYVEHTTNLMHYVYSKAWIL